MDVTVFYAWQDDRPRKLNRYLIREAAKDACQRITDDPANNFNLHLDQDTAGQPGMCDIPNTILEKIQACDVFLADLTFIGNTEAEARHDKLISNPNVLLELGYAVGSKAGDESDGFDRVIGVMNVAYGDPGEQAFDIKRRQPIRYDLPEASEKAGIERQQKALSEDIQTALRTILDGVVLPRREGTAAERFQNIRNEFEKTVRDGSFHGLHHGTGAVTICLVPDVAVKLGHKQLQQSPLPLLRSSGQREIRGNSVLWVDKIPLGQTTEPSRVNIVEFKVDGMILAADLFFLIPTSKDQQGNEQRHIHMQELQSEIVKTIMDYGNALHPLNVPTPWRLGISLLNVSGYRIVPQSPDIERFLSSSMYRDKGFVPAGSNSITAQEVHITSFEAVQSLEAVAGLLKDTFDFFWRECNIEHSFS
jgi:hypothetical protein